MARATSSLPLPLSPSISTVNGAACRSFDAGAHPFHGVARSEQIDEAAGWLSTSRLLGGERRSGGHRRRRQELDALARVATLRPGPANGDHAHQAIGVAHRYTTLHARCPGARPEHVAQRGTRSAHSRSMRAPSDATSVSWPRSSANSATATA